jgi:hypothetical protein
MPGTARTAGAGRLRARDGYFFSGLRTIDRLHSSRIVWQILPSARYNEEVLIDQVRGMRTTATRSPITASWRTLCPAHTLTGFR